MTNSHRKTVLGRLLCAATLGAGALGALGTTGAMAQEIDIWTLNFSSEKANNALNAIAQEFEEANPGVDIIWTQRGVDELKTALRVSAGTDSGPDIFFSWAGLGLGGEYVAAGMSQPLDSYYDSYKWDDTLLPTAAAFASSYGDGHKHGVPFTFKGEAVYYNKALFEKAGITEEPTTYDALVAAAQALKDAGIPAFAFGGSVNWHVMRLMDVLLETECGAQTHDALVAMEANWSETPCATEAFAQMQMWGENYFLKPFMGIDQPQSFNLFVAGRAAMMLEGNWLVQQLNEVSDLDNYGLFAFPTGTDRLYGFAEYHYISAGADDPDMAAKFLDYFNSTDVQQRYLGAMTTNSVNADVVYENQLPLETEWNALFAQYDAMFVNGDQGFPASVTAEYFRVINQTATGDMTPQDAADALQSYIDNLG
ncbi:Multiple sugar-binding protein precursor [Aquimixticola soesokkakensis]|uniref:Multiple sugar-binding protein n=1 Tax=Aquimixticola soesokkakensis TaxID=1519096 RepID=A0A1Y5RWQ8_9RHOB|nr:extracellular solute-binding protein [Aquimixticola soesokkakensis]SLN27210.1 Multiple sugar-binding protein precursor [Aquimixticola soesokkakensis]